MALDPDVNLWGVIHGPRAFLHCSRQQREGHIVNTASIAALAGHAMLGAYTASKFAVAGLSDPSATSWPRPQPGAHSPFCPGPVQTSIRSSERNRPARVPPASPRPGTTESRPAAAGTIPAEYASCPGRRSGPPRNPRRALLDLHPPRNNPPGNPGTSRRMLSDADTTGPDHPLADAEGTH